MFKLLHFLKAKYYNVPFSIKHHWNQFYSTQKHPLLLEDRQYQVIIFDNYANVGDDVIVLQDETKFHHYIITKIHRDSTGELSNKKFDLQYRSTV